MARRDKEFAVKLAAAEVSGQQVLRNAVQSEKNLASGATLFRVADWLEKSKKGERYLPSQWIITRQLYAYPPVGAVALDRELEWASVVLTRFSAQLKRYVEFKLSFQHQVLRSNWEEARDLLNKFEQEEGASFSGIELRTALIQKSGGTSSQVSFSRKLEDRSNSSYFKWFLRLCSLRNEEHVSYVGFNRQLEELISNSKLSENEEVQFRWHALRQIPESPSSLAALLNDESNSSPLDYFEVFLAVSVKIVSNESLSKFRQPLRTAILRLLSIPDQRIATIDLVLDPRAPKIKASPLCYPYSIEGLLPESAVGKIGAFEKSAEETRLVDDLRSQIHDILYKEHLDTTRMSIMKVASNFYYLPVFARLHDFGTHYLGNEFHHLSVAPAVGLNTSAFSPYHCLGLPDDLKSSLIHRFINYSANSPEYVALAAEIDEIARVGFEDHGLGYPELLAELGVKDFLRGDINALSLTSKKLAVSGRKFEYVRALLNLVRAATLPDNISECLAAAVEACGARPDVIRAANLRVKFESVFPMRLSRFDAMHYAVVVAQILKDQDSDKLRDKLLVAVDRIAQGTDNFVIGIENDELGVSAHWLTFLFDVLLPDNVGLVDGISSLRDALTFRSSILRYLMRIDKGRKIEYEDQLKNIAFDLVLDEGMRHVDQSRLYVNLEGLVKWAGDHVQEEFERYREFAKVDVLSAFGDAPATSTLQGNDLLERVAALPRAASDDQLIQVLTRLKNAYLSEPRCGLDGFMSLRIRHGSLAGTLGSGFDEQNLLVLRSKSAGGYGEPLFWFNELDIEDSALRDLLSKHFRIFAAEFQALLDDLLNVKVRVRSNRYPDGLIDIDILESFLKGLKLDIASGASFEDILNLIFLAYKNSVSIKLQVLTNYLQGEFLSKVSLAAERLAVEVKSLIMENQKAGRLADAVTSALLAFRGSVNKVSGWLQVAHKDDLSQLFTLEQIVLIAADYTRNVRIGFSPTITTRFQHTDIKLTGHSLVVLVDALFILLDNVFWHAGGHVGRSVGISVEVNESDHIIKLVVENDLAPFKDRSEILDEFGKTRRLLETAEIGSHMTEGKSGFLKLKQISAQSKESALKFGLVEDMVRVELLIPYTSLRRI